MYEIGTKHFFKEYLCALQVYLHALVSRPVCAHSLGGTMPITKRIPSLIVQL